MSAAPAGPRIVPQRQFNKFVYVVSRSLTQLLCLVLFRVRVEGGANVPRTGPVLLVANHCSYIDPPLLGIGAGRIVRFLAQSGLAKLGLMRWWLRAVGVTLIDRNAPSKDAMRLLADCLREGEVVGLFPEGTRSQDGAVQAFRSGVEFLARRGRAVVVPVGIQGSHLAYPRGVWLPRLHKVIVRYGKPWTTEELLADGGVERLRAQVAELARAPLAPLRAIDPKPTPAAASRATSVADSATADASGSEA